MKDTRIYNVNIDIKNAKILDENFESQLQTFINNKMFDKYNFKLVFIDNNIISEKFNWAVNKFVEEFMKEEGPFANPSGGAKLIERFITGLCNLKNGNLKSGPDTVSIEVFHTKDRYKNKYFRVYFPKGIISEERYNNLMVLGPDWIFGEFSYDVLMDYVYPALFWFLYEEDEMNNEEYLDFKKYMFGLA